MPDIDKTLIQKTVYFYKSDVDKWNAIEKKTQFLHNALEFRKMINGGSVLSGALDRIPAVYPIKTPKAVPELKRDDPKWSGPIPKKKK